MFFDEHFLQKESVPCTVIQGHFPQETAFSIDTRSLQPGDIFVALQGVNVDGHEFLADALKKKAAGLIVSTSKMKSIQTLGPLPSDILLVAVNDPLTFLMQAAAAWRRQFSYPVIAITGSVGKTSTKQLLSTILNTYKMCHLVSHGNQNTRLGLALNILLMRENHQVAIFEVGISKRGEMAELAHLLQPTTGIITGIGHCHMEGLGTLVDIALEKRDLFKYFTEDSIGIINGDQPLLAQVSYAHPVIKFGKKTVNQVQARKISIGKDSTTCVFKIYKEKYTITINHIHEAVVFNALAAMAAAHLLQVPHDIILQGIKNFKVVPDRFEPKALKYGKGIVINDCYNANPESMKAALLAFQRIETPAKKIAVLGDMLELGLTSPFWHRQLGRFLRKAPSLRHVILVGEMVEWTRKMIPVGVSVVCVATWQDAVENLNKHLDENSLVLVKGSHGVGLRNLVQMISEPQETVITSQAIHYQANNQL